MAKKKKAYSQPTMFDVEGTVQHKVELSSKKEDYTPGFQGQKGFGALYNQTEKEWRDYIANNRNNRI